MVKDLIPQTFYHIATILETPKFKKQMTFYTVSSMKHIVEVRFYKHTNNDVLSFNLCLSPWILEESWFQLKTILELEMDLALRKFMKGKDVS